MASSQELQERFLVKWELWPVLVDSPFLNDGSVLYAWFIAYDANCPLEKVKKFTKKYGLHSLALKGEDYWSSNKNTTVTISSPIGTFDPKSFEVSGQDLLASDNIYSKSLELNVQNPQKFDVDSILELTAVVGDPSDDCDITCGQVRWPCVSRTIVNASPHSIGIQQNLINGNDLTSPAKFQGGDAFDFTCQSMTASTPLVKPVPIWPSPVASYTSSQYSTPPESPPKIKNDMKDGAFRPTKNAVTSPDEGDSGISSLLSDLSFRSRTPQSGVRSNRGSESDISEFCPTPKRTPRKFQRHSIPNTPCGMQGTSPKRTSSSLAQRKLYPDAKKSERPPWKP